MDLNDRTTGNHPFGNWIAIPSTVHPIIISARLDQIFECDRFMAWCRDNLRGRVHIPYATHGYSTLNSDTLPRPKEDYDNPFHSWSYGTRDAPSYLVLCEDLNDVMKLKLAWC